MDIHSLPHAIQKAAEMAAELMPFRIESSIEIIGMHSHLGGVPVFKVWMNERKVGQNIGGVWFWLPSPAHPLRFSHEREMINAVRSAAGDAGPVLSMSPDVNDMIKRAAPHMSESKLNYVAQCLSLFGYSDMVAVLEQEAFRRLPVPAMKTKPQGRL